MNTTRRSLLQGAGLALPGLAGLAGGGALLSTLSALGQSAPDYRAVIVVLLFGGNDGHNTLVATDAAYTEYQAARANLAHLRASLAALPGSSAGHSFGLHPSLAPLVPLYAAERLAFIANVGPLLAPATAAQVLDNDVPLPPFLMAHPEQVAIQQGWLVSADNDTSGWAGRTLEVLPGALRHRLAGLSTSPDWAALVGRRTAPTLLQQGLGHWGGAPLSQPGSPPTQLLAQMTRLQSNNPYLADYAERYVRILEDSATIARLLDSAPAPAGDWGGDPLSRDLRLIAQVLPRFKADGLRRQVFKVAWGAFDTHAEQRGGGPTTQDTQLTTLARALVALDTAIGSAGMRDEVVTLVLSDFGRTVRPSSGGGSEHAWGNHWLALGGPVAGGQVLGRFPSLRPGGPDDADPDRGGRHVPSIASDQVAATLMRWLGLPPSQTLDVFPWLAAFPSHTLPLLRS